MNEPDAKDVLELGIKTVFGPVHELFLKLTGPAAEEYGLMWQDSLKMRRTKRLVKCLAQTKRMLEEAGLSGESVPDKLLLPIFDGMSLEDDNNLHDMWAALLANASRQESEAMNPGFPAILRQMSPAEAVLLNWIFDDTFDDPFVDVTAFPDFEDVKEALGGWLDALESYQLVRRGDSQPTGKDGLYEGGWGTASSRAAVFSTRADKTYILTDRGRAFIGACRPPAPKAK
jgi:hypothetical protein